VSFSLLSGQCTVSAELSGYIYGSMLSYFGYPVGVVSFAAVEPLLIDE